MVTNVRQRQPAWFCLFFFTLTVWATRTFAQDMVTSVFVAPSEPVVAGARTSVWLYDMNNSTKELRAYFEPRFDADFILPGNRLKTVLTLNAGGQGNSLTVAPGSFVKQEYFLDIPATLHGAVTLDIRKCNPITLHIDEPTTAAATPKTTEAAVSAPPSKSGRNVIGKFFDNHISPYEPIYFLLGNYPAAEFQLSLKFQLFDFTNSYAGVTNLYFAYTQTSYWDLISSDPSFFDTSYKPSVFLYFPNLWSRKDKAIQFDLQGGAEHESNGRGGEMERSIYTAYLQPRVTFGKPGHLQFALQPRVWTYFLVGPNNPDIAQYRGYADLHAFLTLKKEPNSWANFQVETRFRIGDGGAHPGVQIDARYKFPHFNPVIDVQYFEGYGQTLRQYNKEAHGLRVGFCLWYWPDYPAR